MLIIRTYALYGRSRRILALMVSVVVAEVIFALWTILTRKIEGKREPTEYFVPSCILPVSRATALAYAKVWGGLLAFDTLVFALTVYKSFALHVGSGSTLLGLMLRDGSVYFGVMVASTLANILTYLYGGPFTRGITVTLVNNLSSVMITRLMLNLRDPKLSTFSEARPMTTFRFRSATNFTSVVDHSGEIATQRNPQCGHLGKT